MLKLCLLIYLANIVNVFGVILIFCKNNLVEDVQRFFLQSFVIFTEKRNGTNATFGATGQAGVSAVQY